MKLIKRFLQGGVANIDTLFRGLGTLTLQAGLQKAMLSSNILASNTPQKNDFIKNESFVDPNAPVNYLTPAMQEGGGIFGKGISLLKSLFMPPNPDTSLPKNNTPPPKNTYKVKEPLEPDIKSNPDRGFFAGPKFTDTKDPGFVKTPQLDSAFIKTPKLITKSYLSGDKLPTAPKAEDRYANSFRIYPDNAIIKYDIRYLNGTTRGVRQNTPYTTIPATIMEHIEGNDSTYYETPDLKRFRLRGFPVTRTASNNGSNRQEFETMRNRFNTAWGIAKNQEGGQLGGSNKFNRFISEPYPIKTPEIIVNSSKPYRFDRRTLDLGNGYGVTSDVMFRSYINGKHQGDYSDIMAGRTIYLTPTGNDTIYNGYTKGWGGNSKWIEYDHGLMPIMSGSPNGKAQFYKTLNKSYVRPENKEEVSAFKRALKGYQTGGPIERADNTRVQKKLNR